MATCLALPGVDPPETPSSAHRTRLRAVRRPGDERRRHERHLRLGRRRHPHRHPRRIDRFRGTGPTNRQRSVAPVESLTHRVWSQAKGKEGLSSWSGAQSGKDMGTNAIAKLSLLEGRCAGLTPYGTGGKRSHHDWRRKPHDDPVGAHGPAPASHEDENDHWLGGASCEPCG